jgi:hypothetical protein
MIECSLIDFIPELGHTLVPLIWLYWSDHTLSTRWEWRAIIPSYPLVTIVFYHAMEVSCYHFFWAVKLQLCLCLVTLGSITCKCLQVFSWSAQNVELSALIFKSASWSCLRIHLDCLTAIKSNLFGLQDCLKGCRGGHQGELIHPLGIPLAPTTWLSGEPAVSIVSSCGRSSPKKGWWYRLWMHLDPI